jgi:3-oxoacyl-(acyl-carrier-protein) synthase
MWQLSCKHSLLLPVLLCRLLAGESGVQAIDRFDASEFPTRFAAQIKNFDDEG